MYQWVDYIKEHHGASSVSKSKRNQEEVSNIYQIYQKVSDVSNISQVYQIYINNEDICNI